MRITNRYILSWVLHWTQSEPMSSLMIDIYIYIVKNHWLKVFIQHYCHYCNILRSDILGTKVLKAILLY